jgi:hypothetical protein
MVPVTATMWSDEKEMEAAGAGGGGVGPELGWGCGALLGAVAGAAVGAALEGGFALAIALGLADGAAEGVALEATGAAAPITRRVDSAWHELLQQILTPTSPAGVSPGITSISRTFPPLSERKGKV